MNLILAEITGSQIGNMLIWLIIIGVIYWLLSYTLDQIQPKEPVGKIARVILLLLVVVLLINALLTLVDKPFIRW